MFLQLSFYLASNIDAKPLDILINPFQHYSIPLDNWISALVEVLVDNYRPFFQVVRTPIQWLLGQTQLLLLNMPPLLIIFLCVMVAWQIADRRVAAFTLTILLLIGFVQAWEPAMVSLTLVLTSV